MEQMKGYLLSILAAATICGIVTKLTAGQTLTSGIIKLIAGLFLTVTIVSPFVKLQIGNLATYFEDLEARTEDIITDGEISVRNELKQIILQNTEAYILDKASSYGVTLQVRAEIGNLDTMIPNSVTLEGNVSPYIKQQIQKLIAEDLGIPEEKQIWISS